MGKRKDVRGNIALLTGAGRGIGRATALRLAQAGATVVVSDLDMASAETTVRAIEASGGRAFGFRIDVLERADFEARVEEIEQRVGPIDLLVNNAGIMTVGPFLAHTEADDRLQIDLNLLGVATGMRVLLPRMLRRKRGTIVNMASLAGKVPTAHAAMYAATKHAVVGLTESVRAELDGQGVDFAYVMPGFVNTELTLGVGAPVWPPPLSPEQVADAVLAVVEQGGVGRTVPAAAGWVLAASGLLPGAVRDAIGRWLRVDRMFASVDWKRRATYLERIRRPATPRNKPVQSS